ncbi:MAG: hypothetical protein NT027_13825 [Proteobacteria bacterium]|nr:hypothetical protein [Pseudomonadota bacterium]
MKRNINIATKYLLAFFANITVLSIAAGAEDLDSLRELPNQSEDLKVSPDTLSLIPQIDQTHRYALGINLAWQSRRDYGDRYFRRFFPEILGYVYGPTPVEQLFWRGGARLGYSSDQPEMPQSIQITEQDTTIILEGALTRNWYWVPSIAFALGYDFKTTKVKSKSPIESVDDRINKKEKLLLWHIQAGLGLPLFRGDILIEPIIRYQQIELDDRAKWLLGFEWTWSPSEPKSEIN